MALEGTLSKWTNVMKGWQNRWFVLENETSLLSYYTVSFSCFFLLRLFFLMKCKKLVTDNTSVKRYLTTIVTL